MKHIFISSSKLTICLKPFIRCLGVAFKGVAVNLETQ